MNSLFVLSNKFKEIELKMESGEELSGIEINKLMDEITEKTDDCVGYLMSLEDFEAALNERKKQIDAALKAVKTKTENFEKYIITCLDNLGAEQIQGKTSCFKKRKPVDIVVIEDENLIPLDYVKVKTVTDIDKAGIKNALKNGEKIDGAKLEKGKVGLIYKFGV